MNVSKEIEAQFEQIDLEVLLFSARGPRVIDTSRLVRPPQRLVQQVLEQWLWGRP